MSASFSSPTDDLLSIVRSKNRCLERLLTATREFLAYPVDTLVMKPEANDPLSVFDAEREAVIRTLGLFDRKAAETMTRITEPMRTKDFLDALRAELQRGERLVAEVVGSDEGVFQRIREAQARIQKLVQDSRRSKDNLSKFKSSWVKESGEEMDQKL